MKHIIKLLTFIFLVFVMASCNITDDLLHVHEYEDCYNTAYHWKECSCGISTPQLSHNIWTKYDDNKEYKITYCTQCEYNVKEKHTHVFKETYVAPTCKFEGYLEKKCDCYYTIIAETYEVIPHKITEYSIEKYPTLTETGNGNGKCSGCGNVEFSLPALNSEEYSSSITIPASCSSTGEKTYVISIYGYEVFISVEIEKLEHSLLTDVIPPTCTTDGYTSISCENCSYVETKDFVNHIGHNYTTISIVTTPTYDSEGSANQTCLNCENTINITLPVLNETAYIKVIETPNDCENNGLDKYTYIEDNSIVIEVVTEKTGHDYHDVVTEPTCTEQGYTTYTCTNCQDSYVDDYVEANGHNYSSWSIVEDPTLENTGQIQRSCTIHTDVIQTQELPILSETAYELTVITQASCAIEGELKYSITVNDQEFAFNIVTEMLDHPYNNLYTFDSTNHWLETSCEHELTKNVEAHTLNNGICETCDYSIYTFELNERNTYTITKISDSTSQTISLPISYKGIVVDSFKSVSQTTAINIIIPKTYVDLGSLIGGKIENVYYAGTIADFCNANRGSYYGNTSMNYYFLDNSNEYYKLTDLVIPEGVESLECNYTFLSMPITSVTLPSTIKNVSTIFNNNTIKNVYFNGTAAEWCEITFRQANCNPATLTKSLYIKGDNNEYELLTEVNLSGVTTVNKYTFNSFDCIETIYISDSLEKIDTNAFLRCNNIKNVYYNDTLENWGKVSIRSYTSSPLYYAENFYVNENGTYVLPTSLIISNIENVEANYAGITSIKDLYISKDVVKFANNAFINCSNLENVYYEGTIDDWCNLTFASANANPMNYAKNFYLLISNEYELVTKLTITSDLIKKYTLSGFVNVSEIIISESTTNLEDYAFYNNKGLESLSIPNSITTIPEYFIANSNIKDIYLCKSVTSSEGNAFYNCSNLENVYYSSSIDDWATISFSGDYSSPMESGKKFYELKENEYKLVTSVTLASEQINTRTFAGFDCLTSVTIEKTVKTIMSDVFIDCNNITEVLYNGSITDWMTISFENVYSNPNYIASNFKYKTVSYGYKPLTALEIPSNTTIGIYQFAGMDDLIKVTLKGTVSFGFGAFEKCNSLAEIANFRFSYINYNSFGYLFGAETYEENNDYIPSSLKTINLTYDSQIDNTVPEYAFYQVSSLENVTIGANYQAIGANAFYKCSGLKSISIGVNTKTINTSAFYGCEALQSYNIERISHHLDITFENIYANPLYYANKITCNGIELNNIVIPYKTTEIKAYAFANAKLNSVIIPSTVTAINSQAFNSADINAIYNESSVNLANKATNYYTSFTYAYELKEDNTYKIVGASYSLSTANIPNTYGGLPVTTIDSFAFYEHPKLTTLNLDNNTKTISDYAFYNASALTTINFKDTNLTIGSYAFYSCEKISKLSLSENNKVSIGSYAFTYCTSITELTLTDNITVGLGAFKNCNGITKLTTSFIGGNDGVSSHEYIGFIFDASSSDRMPQSLIELRISNVPTLTKSQFTQAGYIKTLYISNDTTKIEKGALFYFTRLVNLTIPFIGETSASTTTKYLGHSFGASSYSQNADWVPPTLYTLSVRDTNAPLYAYEFYDCKYIYSMSIVADFTTIPRSCFENCETLRDFNSHDMSLGDYVDIETGVTTIEENAFKNNKNLYKIKVSNDLKKIEKNAFEGCLYVYNLYTLSGNTWESIEFGNEYSNPMAYGANFSLDGKIINHISLASDISSYAFYGCESLTDVTISKSVTKIGKQAFGNTPNFVRADIKGIMSMYYYKNGSKVSFASMDYLYSSSTEQAQILINASPYDIYFLQ